MKSELLKRIITSIVIFPILLFVLLNSKLYLIIFLFLFYLLSFYEIYKNSNSLKFIKTNINIEKIITEVIILFKSSDFINLNCTKVSIYFSIFF